MDSQPIDLADLVPKAEAGDSSAQCNLGVRYKDSSLVLKRPKSSLYGWFRNGEGLTRDRETAKRWLMRAVNQGNGNATIFMVDMLREDGTPASLQLAFDLLKQLDEHYLGQRRPWDVFDIYEPGCEFLRMKENLLLLADKGHMEAQLEIVRQYLVRRGVLDDRSEGVAWWVMPLFGIVPSILNIAPSPDQPSFEDEPAVSIALRNYHRAEEWFQEKGLIDCWIYQGLSRIR